MSEPELESAPGRLAGPAEVLFQQAGDGLLLIDSLTERVLDANLAAQRMTEFSRTELLEMALRSLIRHEQQWHDWSLPLLADVRDGLDGFQLRTRQPQRWIPIRLGMAPMPLGEGETVLLVRLNDQSTRIDLQYRAEQAEAELRRVLVRVSECLWSCHVEQGRWAYRYLSPAVERLTGRAASDFLDLPDLWHQVVDPEDLPAWRDFRHRLTIGQPGALEYRFCHRAGRGSVRVREQVLIAPDQRGLLLHGMIEELPEHPRAPDNLPAIATESLTHVDDCPRELGATAIGPDAARAVVFLAEDDPAVRDVVSRLLVSVGCKVVTAQDGEEAIACYRRHASEIRLALIDLSMPRISGDEVARELRRLSADLPIVLMSGHADLNQMPQLADLHLAGYLQKPFRLPEILDLLGRILLR